MCICVCTQHILFLIYVEIISNVENRAFGKAKKCCGCYHLNILQYSFHFLYLLLEFIFVLLFLLVSTRKEDALGEAR